MGCVASNNSDNGFTLSPAQAKRLSSIAAELGMTNVDIKKIHKCFRRCPINQLEKIDIETFATQQTVYPDVLFTCARLFSSNSNELNFEEFFVCLYNLITHPTKELHTLVFQCYDVNEDVGTLTEEEIMHLISILWKFPKDIVLETLKQRTWDGPVLLGTFIEICVQFPRMMMPVIDLQNIMISNTVGHARAKTLSEHRTTHFSEKSIVHIVNDMKVKPSCYANMMKKVRHTLQSKQRIMQKSNVPEHIRDQANAIRSGRRSSDSVTSMASSQKSTARSRSETEKNINREMLLSTHLSVPQPLRQRALSADKVPYHQHRNIFANRTKNTTTWSSEKIDGVGYMDKTNRPKSESQAPPRALSADHIRKTGGKHYLPTPAQIAPIIDNNNNDEDQLDKYVSSKLGVKPSLISSEKAKLRRELRKKISKGHNH